ncbi:uncharacterized protein LOC144328279 [Podarcis muralis]
MMSSLPFAPLACLYKTGRSRGGSPSLLRLAPSPLAIAATRCRYWACACSASTRGAASERAPTSDGTRQGPLAVPVPTVPASAQEGGKQPPPPPPLPGNRAATPGSPRRVIVQASTGELLRCLGDFVCRRCYHIAARYWACACAIAPSGFPSAGIKQPASLLFLIKGTSTLLPLGVSHPKALWAAGSGAVLPLPHAGWLLTRPLGRRGIRLDEGSDAGGTEQHGRSELAPGRTQTASCSCIQQLRGWQK